MIWLVLAAVVAILVSLMTFLHMPCVKAYNTIMWWLNE